MYFDDEDVDYYAELDDRDDKARIQALYHRDEPSLSAADRNPSLK